jgi:hypothetical protein
MRNKLIFAFALLCAAGGSLLSPASAQTRSWIPNGWMGSGAPNNSFGSEGQYFLDVATGGYYGPKTNGAWPASSPLVVQTAFPVTVSGGVSGGIPCFTSTTVEAASTLLATNAVVIGGGAAACPTSTTTGTGVVTGIGTAVNTNGGFVTASTASIASGALLTGGGSATAISGITPGTGVAAALAIATGEASGFVALDANSQITVPGTLKATTGRPTPSASGGTCAVNATATGGAIAGTIAITGVCASTDTITFTWAAAQAAPTGWSCVAINRTAPTALLTQTSTTTTTAVFTEGTVSTGAADVIQYQCIAY